MDKILELLNVSTLNEDDQEAIKAKLEILIESKAQDLVEAKLEAAKEDLAELYESKFEEYKDTITSKFSTFVDEVLEEEMVIPDHIVEYARKGELYEDLIEEFKTRLRIDEGVGIEDEVKELIAEARDEIIYLSEQLDEATDKTFDATDLLREARAELIKHELCEGLTIGQKNKVMALLEGIIDVNDIESKFDFITESLGILNESDDDDKDGEDPEDESGDEDEKKEKKEKDEKDLDEALKGKGKSEVLTEEEKKNTGAWANYMNEWTSQLKKKD